MANEKVRPSAIRSSISIKALMGNLKGDAILAMAKADKVLLGRIGGIANAEAARKTDPQDDEKVSLGLRGTFRAVPNNDDLEIVNSGTCYLRDEVHGIVAAALRDRANGANEGGAETVGFAFDVFVMKAGNKAGFTYEHQPVGEKPVDAIDPLAMIMSGGTAKAKLAAPQDAKKK